MFQPGEIEVSDVYHLPIIKAFADRVDLVNVINRLVPSKMEIDPEDNLQSAADDDESIGAQTQCKPFVLWFCVGGRIDDERNLLQLLVRLPVAQERVTIHHGQDEIRTLSGSIASPRRGECASMKPARTTSCWRPRTGRKPT